MGEETRQIEQLQRENAILRQNAQAASKAPVRGVSSGGASAEKPKSSFLVGLESDGW